MQISKNIKRNWRVVFYLIGLFPAAWLLWEGQAGELGADPVNVFERGLGLWAFRFLLICFALAPLQSILQIKLVQFRRLTGLLAFFYAIFHLAAYLFLDLQFNFSVFIEDITHRPFIILGMLALLLLLPMAITSNRLSMRLLKRRWKQLHLLIYPTNILISIHFYLSYKMLNKTSALYIVAMIFIWFLRGVLKLKGKLRV